MAVDLNLYDILNRCTTELDLGEICLVVQVEYNRLEGTSQAERCLSLYTMLKAQDRLDDLEKELRKRFPKQFRSQPGTFKPLQAGDIVGDYVVDRPLGKGSFSDTYQAHHQTLDWLACVKIIRTDPNDDKDFSIFADMLKREARLLAELDHPNIVRLRDYGTRQEDNLVYLILEYVDGSNLADSLHKAAGPLPLAQVGDIVKQIAAGLDYAHNKGILHRDLKPHNVLRTPEMRLVLTDFGLAQAVEKALTASQIVRMGVAGTVAYVAPEQCQGQAEYRSDLYSLGILTYHCLTGRVPFVGSMVKLILAHLKQAPPPLRQFNPQITSEVEAAVLKMLAKSPDDRYQSGDEFAQALLGTPVVVPVPGSADKTIMLWGLSSGQERRILSGHTQRLFSVAFSPDGCTLASGSDDNTIKLWDVPNDQEWRTLSGHSKEVVSVAFSPDGRTLASGSTDTTIKLWDVPSGQERHTLSGHSRQVNTVTFSPDVTSGVPSAREADAPRESGSAPPNYTLASGSTDTTIKLWDASKGTLLHTLSGHTGDVLAMGFNPDGHTLASGSTDTTIKLWDVPSGNLLHTLSGHSGQVNTVTFSPDGSTLASGSTDTTIKLWDVPSGQERRTLTGHTGNVFEVDFSPDGHTLASGSDDNILKLWRV